MSLFYHYFAKQKTELTGARRVAKVVGELVAQDDMQGDYEQLASDLLEWIQRTIGWLRDRQFPNSLRELRDELAHFNQFRKEEKPPKYREKGEVSRVVYLLIKFYKLLWVRNFGNTIYSSVYKWTLLQSYQ